MKTIDCNSWEDFESRNKELIEKRIALKSATGRTSSEFLYRDQRDHEWALETTLEREKKGRISLSEYHRLICRVKPQIETFTSTEWKVPCPTQYDKWLGDHDDGSIGVNFPAYDYLAYLRHHGFPSPLLDWTGSPYVAAYFAFAHASDRINKVSIYVYWKTPEGIKGGCVGAPEICSLGPYVRTHSRHFLQQSIYTICVARDRDWYYASHEAAFARDEPDQDLAWKLTIPVSERLKVLKLLDAYNLNGFSLFGLEESLMHTMALRELHFRELVS
jgi:hypothetical protein